MCCPLDTLYLFYWFSHSFFIVSIRGTKGIKVSLPKPPDGSKSFSSDIQCNCDANVRSVVTSRWLLHCFWVFWHLMTCTWNSSITVLLSFPNDDGSGSFFRNVFMDTRLLLVWGALREARWALASRSSFSVG